MRGRTEPGTDFSAHDTVIERRMKKAMSHYKSGSYKETNKVEIRCLECLARIDVALNAKEVECPNCGTRFLIYWPTSDIAKIKGVAQERPSLA